MIMAIEGIDGVGKTTVVERLEEKWSTEEMAKPLVVLHEPFTAKVEEIIRFYQAHLPAEADGKLIPLFAFLLEREVSTAWVKYYIDKKYVVMLDRCYLSSLVYQDVLPFSTNRMLQSLVMGRYHPEIVFYLHAPTSIILRNLEEKGEQVNYDIDKLTKAYDKVMRYSVRYHAVVSVDMEKYYNDIDIVVKGIQKAYRLRKQYKLPNRYYTLEKILDTNEEI